MPGDRSAQSSLPLLSGPILPLPALPAPEHTASPQTDGSPELGNPLGAPALPAPQPHGGSSLAIYALGPFRVYQNDHLIERWPGIKCRSILKYLVAHRDTPVHREVLIDRFWPDASPEAARRNLHQAIYNLRRALQEDCEGCSHILFEEGFYLLNPDMDIWIDSEIFLQHYRMAQRLEREGCAAEAVTEYETAESLYGGEFMAEDPYEDWPIVQRESLKLAYVDILDRLSRHYFHSAQWAICITLCQKILAEDSCREDAHRRLMRCYYRQGHRHLALRQYHVCQDALRRELDVDPMPATVDLYRQMQANGNQFSDERKLRKK